MVVGLLMVVVSAIWYDRNAIRNITIIAAKDLWITLGFLNQYKGRERQKMTSTGVPLSYHLTAMANLEHLAVLIDWALLRTLMAIDTF